MNKNRQYKFFPESFRKKLYLLSVAILAAFPVNQVAADTGFSPTSVEVHQSLRTKISIEMANKPLKTILFEICQKAKLSYTISRDVKIDETARYSLKLTNVTVEEALRQLLGNTKFDFEMQNNLILIINRKSTTQPVTTKITLKGKVVDDKNNPVVGATILIHGTTQGTASEARGNFSLKVKPDDVLRISCIGYKSAVEVVDGRSSITVLLTPTTQSVEEVSVVAFGEQKKESVVSSITTVKPGDLKSSSSDLTSTFAGKIAGVVGWQTGGLPGALTEDEMNTKFYIRGITSFQSSANIDPLILLDGVEASKLDLARISTEDIETFSVLKDAAATAMYGARGANGVILVTTKKGQEGSVYTSFRYEMIASMPTQEIDVVDPITYMKMYNQALIGRNAMAVPKYSVERINRTASGDYPSWVYPANDWYETMFKQMNLNHHFGLNVRGGSKVIQYYASVNHNRDMGMLKTDRLNQFDVNVKNSTTSFRLNLNVNLKGGIKLVLNSSSSLDKYHGPRQLATQVYSMAFNASPVDFAPTYPGDDMYGWPHLRFGTTAAGQFNPYESLHSGYMERTRYSTINRVEYIQNLSSLVKGLELRANVSLNQSGFGSAFYSTVPFKYALDSYDFETGKHKLKSINGEYARRTLEMDKGGSTTSGTSVTYEGRLLHVAAWGGVDKNRHQTSLTSVFQLQEQLGFPAAGVLEGLPNRNLSFSMRGTYGFMDRYFGEMSFGYNGSERFAKSHKMGFFPAGGVAWVISKEPFMRSISNVVSFMKLRYSYGKVGNDGIIKYPRFVYLPTIGSTQGTKDPEPNGSAFRRYLVSSYGNENIRWEIAEQMNLGFESKLFDGLIDFNVDVYREVRHNILSQRTIIPSSMGIEVAPLDNIGKALSRGVDFSGKIQHSFNRDFWFILNGTLTYNKAEYLEIEESSNKPYWQRRKGHDLSQQIGYIAEGLFIDQAEIDNSPFQGGDVMPGDIRYRDLNGDGKITVEDATHIGYPETPRLIYGFSGFVNFKNFEFSFAFQGSGKRSFFMNPKSLSPFNNDHAMLQAIYDDHWSTNNMSKRPFWPRLSTYNITQHNIQEDWYNSKTDVRKSTYFMREMNFLRCTSIEVAYNLPKRIMQKLSLQSVKVYVRTNNPFIITNFKIWDVELGESGFNYPIQRTFSVGINASF